MTTINLNRVAVAINRVGDKQLNATTKASSNGENKGTHVLVFTKHIKGGHLGGRSGRVAVPVSDIRTISESHIDSTTLLRTSDGGTIAVEESFEKAVEMWEMACGR